jgi:hypothetical protein
MLPLRRARYWFFRFKNEAEGGASADDAPEGLRELYEKSVPFKLTAGWKGFAVSWDITDTDSGERVIIPLDKSVWDAWHEECMKKAKALPKKAPDRTRRIKRPAMVEHLEVDAVLKKEG